MKKKTRESQFVQTAYHRYHTHDVHSVCVSNKILISGGNDTQLIVCNNRNFWQYRICSPLSHGFNNGMQFQSPLLSIANQCEWITQVLSNTNNSSNNSKNTKSKQKNKNKNKSKNKKNEDNNNKNNNNSKNKNKMKRVLFLHNNLYSNKLKLWYMYKSFDNDINQDNTSPLYFNNELNNNNDGTNDCNVVKVLEIDCAL